MGLFDWLFGREEEPEPEATRHKAEEEFYDHYVELEESEWASASHSWQMIQQARERLRQRRARERRG